MMALNYIRVKGAEFQLDELQDERVFADNSGESSSEPGAMNAMNDSHFPVMECTLSSSVERKLSSEEDPAATTIEFLRARLLSERSVSKTARQHTRQLTKKVSELERRLESEVQLRKKAETARLEALARLSQDLTMESTESADSIVEEDDFTGKSEGQTESDVGSSLRCIEMEELLQMQNMDTEGYTRSGSAKDDKGSSAGRADKDQSGSSQYLISAEYNTGESSNRDEDGNHKKSDLVLETQGGEQKKERRQSLDVLPKEHCRTSISVASATALTDGGADQCGQMKKPVFQSFRQASEEIGPIGEDLGTPTESVSCDDVSKLDQEGWIGQVVDLPSKSSQDLLRTGKSRIRQDQYDNCSAYSLHESTPERQHKERGVTGDAGGKDGVILQSYQKEEGALSYDDKEVNMEKLKWEADLIEKYAGDEVAKKLWKQKPKNQNLAVEENSSQVINLRQRLEEDTADGISEMFSKFKGFFQLHQTVEDSVKDKDFGSICHLEGNNTQHLLDASNPIVVAEIGSLVDENVSSGLGGMERNMEHYLSKVGNSSQSHTFYSTVKENERTPEEGSTLSCKGDRQINGHGPSGAESQDKTGLLKTSLSEQELQSRIASDSSFNPPITDLRSDQPMLGVDGECSSDQILEPRTASAEMERGGDTRGWPGVHHKRLSSSFKFNVHIDYLEEGTDIVEEDSVVGRSQASKVESSSQILSGLSAASQDLQQQGRLEAQSSSSGDLFLNNRPLMSEEKQLLSQVDPITVDNMASSRERQGGSRATQVLHQTSSDGYNKNGDLVSYIRQDQFGVVGSVPRGDFSFGEPKQTIAIDMKGQGGHGGDLPPIYPYGVKSRRDMPGSFSSTNLRSSNSDVSQHRINTMLQPEKNPVDKDTYDVGAMVGATAGTSGQVSTQEQLLGTNGFRDVSRSEAEHSGTREHSSQALQYRDFDRRDVQTNSSKDSPWIEAFRSRIRQGVDPRQLRSFGSSHEHPYYPARYGVGVETVQSPYTATYLERSKAEHIPNFASRSSQLGYDSHWQSHISRNVWQDPSMLNHHMPFDGSFDRVKDILKALQAVKQQIQSSDEQISFLNHHIGYETRGQGEQNYVLNHQIGYETRGQVRDVAGRLHELPPGYVVPPHSLGDVVPPHFSGVYSQLNPHIRMAQSPPPDLAVAYSNGIPRPIASVMKDSRNMQNFARGQPLGRQNLWARVNAYGSYMDNIQGANDDGRW